MERLLIQNIGLLATPEGKTARRGEAQGKLRFLKDAWVLCEGGVIAALGEGEAPRAERRLDARGRLVTPGLVDAHTHLIFGGWRQNELGDKLHGASYLEILAQGGGILSTVKATRAATEDELCEKARAALDEMLTLGVTTAEAKSGYGLDLDTELKQLRVIRRLNVEQPVELAATFLGAHAVPTEYKADREGYLRLLCEEAIPRVAAEKLAEFCDVFCETGVFTAEESRRILEAGKRCGLVPKIHADEIDPIGGSQLTAQVGAISAEHLIVCPPEGIAAMAEAGTVACCLPATSFYLGSTYAPVRDMIRAGVPVALASDFNPGSCPSLNLQFVMNLGCLKYRMTPEEALTAVTLNAAAAIGRAGTVGSLEAGKQADLVVWDAPDLDMIFYRMGSNLARTVIKKGNIERG
ncbi:MAG: imidazolonepropionase [Oscillospiraceae bacterium]|nr:imidazolonepropionase [Oscillospiraceae bacterium]